MKEKKAKERRLTEAEQRRKERFEAQKEQLEQQGYTARELTVGAVLANFLALIIMLPFILLLFVWKGLSDNQQSLHVLNILRFIVEFKLFLKKV